MAAAHRRLGAGAACRGAFLYGRHRPLSFSDLVPHDAVSDGVVSPGGRRTCGTPLSGPIRPVCRASLVSVACIWAQPAAKSINMNDRPTGIANGLTNYGDRDFSLYLRRSFAQSMGYSRAELRKPVVGIAYTASGFNNCHRHFPELLEAVKRGVLTDCALPVAFLSLSLRAL